MACVHELLALAGTDRAEAESAPGKHGRGPRSGCSFCEGMWGSEQAILWRGERCSICGECLAKCGKKLKESRPIPPDVRKVFEEVTTRALAALQCEQSESDRTTAIQVVIAASQLVIRDRGWIDAVLAAAHSRIHDGWPVSFLVIALVELADFPNDVLARVADLARHAFDAGADETLLYLIELQQVERRVVEPRWLGRVLRFLLRNGDGASGFDLGLYIEPHRADSTEIESIARRLEKLGVYLDSRIDVARLPDETDGAAKL